jgi:hypothetical protein
MDKMNKIEQNKNKLNNCKVREVNKPPRVGMFWACRVLDSVTDFPVTTSAG